VSIGALNVHILTASGRLGPHLRAVEQQIDATFRDARELLELGDDPVDVVVRDAPRMAIPEIGIAGVAPDRHTIFISVDPLHPKLDQAIGSELARTMAHELHHLARRRAGCRGRSLWAAIIHEGLADRFVVELYGAPPPLWSLALPAAALDEATKAAIAEHDSDSYDHGVWFLGKDPAIVPRWAGYAIGWRVVGVYLRDHRSAQPSQLANRSAEAFHVPDKNLPTGRA
jgi:hypothetical protein